MSHPNGDQQEPVYTPGSDPVPSQPPAPRAETYLETPAVPTLAAPITPAFEVPPTPAPAAPVAAPVYPDTAAYPVAGPAVPGPAAPVSAAPGYAPVSAAPYGYAPVSAAPYGYAPVAEAPKKKGRAGIIVLSITTALFGLAAAGMTALYVVEGNAADKKATEQAAALVAEEAKVKDLEAKFATSKSEVAKLNQDVAGAKSKTDEVTKEREALASCFRALDAYEAAKNANTAKEVIVKCAEAEKYY